MPPRLAGGGREKPSRGFGIENPLGVAISFLSSLLQSLLGPPRTHSCLVPHPAPGWAGPLRGRGVLETGAVTCPAFHTVKNTGQRGQCEECMHLCTGVPTYKRVQNCEPKSHLEPATQRGYLEGESARSQATL